MSSGFWCTAILQKVRSFRIRFLLLAASDFFELPARRVSGANCAEFSALAGSAGHAGVAAFPLKSIPLGRWAGWCANTDIVNEAIGSSAVMAAIALAIWASFHLQQTVPVKKSRC